MKKHKNPALPPSPEIPPELRDAFASAMFDVILTTGEVFLKTKDMAPGVNIPEEHWTATRLWAGTMFLRSMLICATEDEELVERLLEIMKQIGEVTHPALGESQSQWKREHVDEEA